MNAGVVGNTEGNLQLQEEELCALESIYADELAVTDTHSYRVCIPDPTGAHLVLEVYLPETYPSTTPPVFELRCDYLPGDIVEQLYQELEVAFSPGEVVLFNWVEHLKERWQELAPQSQQEAEQQQAIDAAVGLLQQVALGESEVPAPAPAPAYDHDEATQLAMAEVLDTIVHGEPFTEKRSTFQAHLAPVSNMQQVEAVMEVLLKNNKIRAATHNIMAYRIEQPEKGTFQQDNDDDGEDAAGGRLLHLLQMVDARNVVVVVSRWYGGILLGPARFSHINNAARQLLDACGYIGGSKGGGGGSKSRTKGKGGAKR